MTNSDARLSAASDQLCIVAADLSVLRTAVREACALLSERTYGSPARSPGHNARLVLERGLKMAPEPSVKRLIPDVAQPTPETRGAAIAAVMAEAYSMIGLELTIPQARRIAMAALAAQTPAAPVETGRNRDPIYAPDGRTWYQTALDEASKRGENEVRIHELETELEAVERSLESVSRLSAATVDALYAAIYEANGCTLNDGEAVRTALSNMLTSTEPQAAPVPPYDAESYEGLPLPLELEITGPYKYDGDSHPCFVLRSTERVFAAVYVIEDDEDRARREAELIQDAMRMGRAGLDKLHYAFGSSQLSRPQLRTDEGK